MINYGQIAYEGYCLSSGNKSLVSGAELPTWDKLDPKIQAAWCSASAAVANAISEDNQKMTAAARRGFEGIQHTCSAGHVYEANPYKPCPKCAELDHNRALD